MRPKLDLQGKLAEASLTPPMGAYRVGLGSICIPTEAEGLVNDCLQHEAVGQSVYLEDFERELAHLLGVKYAVAVSSGTMADAVACASVKYLYGVRRAVVPALTFVAQPNAVLMAGLELDFSDVKEDWTLDFSGIEDWGQGRLLFPTHLMGRAAAVWDIPEGVLFLEDTCEALGTLWKGKAIGTFGIAGTLSFFVSHTLTTGEGGAILTDSPDVARICRQLRSHGRASESDVFRKFSFPYQGFNAKMSGLTAAFGLAVLKHADEYLAQRRENYLRLDEKLGNFPERAWERVIPHSYPVGFKSETARNIAMQNLLKLGVECRKFFNSIPLEEAYQNPRWTWKRYPVAEHLSRTHLLIPCHQRMSGEDADWMAEQVLNQNGRI